MFIMLNYEVVSKIFWTDTVKIEKLTIRPIGCRYPRSSSLLHVDTGPTISSIFGMLPGSSFLSECQALHDSVCISSVVSNRYPFSFNFIFGNRKNSQGAKYRGVRWVGDDSHFVFRQKLLGEDGSVRRGIFMVKQPGLFSPKFGATSSRIFTQSQ